MICLFFIHHLVLWKRPLLGRKVELLLLTFLRVNRLFLLCYIRLKALAVNFFDHNF